MLKAKTAWAFLILLLFLAGISLVLFAQLPYDTLQTFMDRLAKDGQLESFTPGLHKKLGLWQWVGWMMTACAMGMILARSRTQRLVGVTLKWFGRVGRVFRDDAQFLWNSFFRATKAEKGYLLVLGAVFVIAIINSGRYLSRPMIYDEAYTYNIFASRPVLRIISDYHLPNNHIFHSLLVHFSTLIFGSHPWAVRLPAFIAGTLLVPAGYMAARAFFDRDAAILSAGLIAFAPILINYSTNARGYSFVALITLLLLALAAYLRQQQNQALWVLMIFLSVIGFYTLPTMLFPFGALGLWLLLCSQRQQVFVYRIIAFVGITALLVVILYTPVIITSGLDSLLKNPFVAPIDIEDYWIIIEQRLTQTWTVFNKGVPPLLTWILVFAFMVGILLHPRRASFPVVLLLFSAALVILRRNAPFDRMWLFLMPIFLIWASAGLVWIFRQTIERRIPPVVASSLKVVLLLLFCTPQILGGAAEFQRSSEYNIYAENVALFLGDKLKSDDQVAVTFPLDAPIIYYMRLHGFDDGDTFATAQESPQMLYLLVNENADQTVDWLLEKKGIKTEALDMASQNLQGEIFPVSIYQIEYKR